MSHGTTSARELSARGLGVLLGGLALAGLALGGCASDDAASGVTTLAPIESGTMDIGAFDNNFRPEEVTVTKGTEVVWTNTGRNDHNIIPDGDTPFRVEVDDFLPGETYTWMADTVGTFHYYCSIHGTPTAGMIGVVQVVDEQ